MSQNLYCNVIVLGKIILMRNPTTPIALAACGGNIMIAPNKKESL